ncbi:MAG: hypothetical protein QOI55_2103, partial [Actinomycetota bacterium]|nr:hypothetical protein [Actinomycetota bacterium]
MTQLSHPASPGEIRSSFFDNSVIRDAQTAVDFIGTILESSTEYSIIGTDLEGTILLWNEGARRLYGYEPDEVVGKFTSAMLHTPDEVAAGTPREILDAVLRDGKWEGTLTRLRKSGEQFTARVVVTPRHDRAGAVGYLLISKDITGEIRMTEELEATQSYTRSLVESNMDALITTDPLGVITDVNQQMETLTDRGREALVGTPLKDYFTEPDRVEDCIRLVLREGKVTDYELTARRPDGSMTVVSYNASTFYNNDGKLRGVFATARDVTDKRLLAHERRESEAYNRGLIEASADGLIMVEPSGTISDVNEQMCRMMGYSREELVGSGFPDYFVDAERARAHIAEIFAQGVTRDYIQTLATSTGDEIEMWFNASVLRDQSGEVQGLVATARDITETARVQSEVTEERAYFRGLIEASLDLLVAVDPTLVITDVNDTMCRMSGYARDELIGTPFQHYFTDPKRAAACVRQTLDRASVTDYELTLRTNTGVERLVSFNAATFEDTSGGLRGIIATARDITGQARLRSELTEERAYNRGLIEASVDGIITVDAAMTITDVNERMCTMVGRPRQQLISTPFADYFDERELAVEGVRQTFEAGSVTNHVLTLRTSHGTTVPVSINAAVYRDVDDAVLGVFASARDITAQNQLEKELREQHFYTRSLIESNIDATVTTDPVGVVTDVNEQMETLTGRSREQLIGTPFKSYFTDPDRAEDGIREVLREGRVTNYELTARRPDGSTTVVSYNNSIFYDHDGKLRGVFGAARDITEQKRMEEELQEQQTYLRGLIEASFDGLITVDQEGYITDVNDRICVMSGYDRAELIGTSFSGYFTDPGSADSGVRDTFETGFVSEHELTLVSRSRRQLRVSINASIFRDDAGDVRGIVASARDITERVRLETQLREQQTYLRGLIESSADGLATVDPEGYVTDVNEEMCRMTGWARDELVGTLFRTYFTDPQRAEEGVLRTLADGVVTNFALELRGKSGRKATVSVNSSVFRGADGEMQGIVASARDISEQARLQTELGEQQAYNRSLIESSADAFFVIAPDGVITDINAEASRLTRYSRKHLVNLQFADLFTETEVAR